MEKQSKASINGDTRVCATIADLRVRVAEHILAQYDYYGTTEVRNILDETKAGAWRRPTLLKVVKTLFSTS